MEFLGPGNRGMDGPCRGEFKWTSRESMCKTALWEVIHLIPRIISIPCPLRIIREEGYILLSSLSGTLLSSRLVLIFPPGDVMIYGVSVTVGVICK